MKKTKSILYSNAGDENKTHQNNNTLGIFVIVQYSKIVILKTWITIINIDLLTWYISIVWSEVATTNYKVN